MGTLSPAFPTTPRAERTTPFRNRLTLHAAGQNHAPLPRRSKTRFSKTSGCDLAPAQPHSYRRISTGKIRAAERAGISVAPMLMAMAAAAIHTASRALGLKGTNGTAYTCGSREIGRAHV